MLIRHDLLTLVGAAALLGTLGGSAQTVAAPRLAAPLATPTEARNIAADAFLFAYPLLLTYRELDRQLRDPGAADYVGTFNAFRHQQRLPTPADQSVRMKSYDAPYSWAWLDLRAEPIILEVPALPAGRFVVFQWYDLWGHNLAQLGSVTTGFRRLRVLIAGPAWKGPPPKGIDSVVKADTWLVGGTVRTSTAAPGDGASVVALQSQYRLTPLSVFGKRARVKPAPPIALPPWDEEKSHGSGFIGYVNALLPLLELDPAEGLAFRRFAAIGIGAGTFDASKLDPAHRSAVDGGVADASSRLEKAMVEAHGAVDPVGTREAFGGDVLKRAVSAGFGLHRIATFEIAEFDLTGDGSGDPYDRSSKYRLQFAGGRAPPVDYFWSLEMIAVPQARLVDNPIDRYVIDSRMAALGVGADGSIEIAIQRTDPGGALTANWLPSPAANFTLTLRLYGAKPEAVAGRWRPPLPNRLP